MKCVERDQDILMLVHGELSVMRKMMVVSHVSRCPRCQEKRSEFTRISTQIASTIRSANRALPKWAPLKSAASASSRHIRHFVMVFTLMLTAAMIAAGAVHIVNANKRHASHPTIIRACTPGIPCDQCR